MSVLEVLVALLAVVMLARHGPGALRFVAPGGERRAPHAVALVNALLALAILAGALRGVLRHH
jgi:hypothetical protein